METTNFSIHDLFKFKITGSGQLYNFIKYYFDYFIVEQCNDFDLAITFTKVKPGIKCIGDEYEKRGNEFIIKKYNSRISIKKEDTKYFFQLDKTFHKGWLLKNIENIMRFKLVENNAIFMHASSFYYLNNNYLFLGWKFSGKSLFLLQFLKRGADYIGDDKVIITKKGEVLAVPLPIHLRYYHIDKFPRLIKQKLNEKIITQIVNVVDSIKTNRVKLVLFKKFFSEFIGPEYYLKLNDLFPKCKIKRKSKLKNIYLLSIQKNFKKIKMEGNKIINKLNSLNNEEFNTNIFQIAYAHDFLFPNANFTKSSLDLLEKERTILQDIFKDKEIIQLNVKENIDPEVLEKMVQ